MKKGGISAVVATVLIILIVVVGVGIVWKVVLPLFAKLDYLSYSDVQLNIVLKGYTVYDFDRHFAFVQIERGRDEINITGLEIGFNFGGSTKTYQTMKVPQPGGKHTYKFNFTADGIAGVPNKVTVAPIFILNNQIKLGRILDEEDMPVGKIHLSESEWEKAIEEATENKEKVILPGGEVCNPSCGGASCGDGNGCGGKCIIQDCGLAMVCDNSGECVEDPDIEWNILTGCAVLDEPGQAYKFESDFLASRSDLIDDACVTIDAENVVVDIGGNTLSYDYLSGWGDEEGFLITSNGNNSEIRNGNVEDFARGIYLIKTGGNTFQSLGVRASNLEWYVGADNVYGVILDSSNGNFLRNVVIEDTFFIGLDLMYSSDNIFQNLDLSNGGVGIGLISSPDNSFSEIFIEDSESYGFYVENSEGITATNLEVQNGASEGLSIQDSNEFDFKNVVLNNNPGYGARIQLSDNGRLENVFINNSWRGFVASSFDGMEVYDLTVKGSDRDGVTLTSCTNSYFEGINSSFNGGDGDGMEVISSIDNTFVNIFTGWNGDDGFEIESGNNNSIYNLYSIGNFGSKSEGIKLDEGSHQHLENIYVKGNGRRGVDIEESDYNTLINITAESNVQQGVRLRQGATYNRIIGLNSSNNGMEGIYFDGSSFNNLSNANIKNNNGGIRFFSAWYSQINNSLICENGPSNSDLICSNSPDFTLWENINYGTLSSSGCDAIINGGAGTCS